MGEEVKKISFGFSKLVKKTSIVSSKLSQPKTENKVEFIDCVEGKSIKLKDPKKPEDTVLVIPLKRETKDNNVNKELGSRPTSPSLVNGQSEVGDSDISLDYRPAEETNLSSKDSDVKKETLDEIAAREILEDLSKKQTREENQVFTVPLTSNAPSGEAESSIDDYENIPVSQFGLAMLRGMGWAPGKGIGKNEKLVTPSLPTLRPKGMGLGADKVLKAAIESGKPNDKDLKMAKGSFVRIVAGTHKDCYGLIEGFDDESGRMFVKIALKNISVSLNEFMTQLVDKNEYLKNSKVINVGKYERYKDEENKKDFSDSPKREEHHKKKPSNSSDQSKLVPTSNKSRHRSRTPEDAYNRSSGSSLLSRHSNSYSTSNRPTVRQDINSSSKTRRSHSSSSNQTSGSDSDYSDRKKHRIKKKKPSSHRHKSRTRSRSPKHHKSHKKHKKRK